MRFLITYDSMDGHYIFHTKDVKVQFNKDEMGLPYIDTRKKSGRGIRTDIPG